MKINYKKFANHAEKLVKESSQKLRSIPALQGIHHTKDGTVYVTNSHYAYKAERVNGPQDVTTHAITGEIIQDSYPDLEKTFPDPQDSKTEVTVNAQKLIGILKAMQHAYATGTKRRNALVRFSGNKIYLAEREKEINFEYSLSEKEMDHVFDKDMVLNSQYLLNSLEMILDVARVESVTFYYYRHEAPILVTPENSTSLQALILPIRKV